MAAERSRRYNAGSKMARLLEAEDEDDFYKTTYGGFNEVMFGSLFRPRGGNGGPQLGMYVSVSLWETPFPIPTAAVGQ